MDEQKILVLEEPKPVERVDEYRFEPIKGYPMLHWKGKRPFEATQFYPAQLKETHGADVGGWLNRIYWGDNLQVMSHLLKEFRGKVNLIYIDPPFDSRVEYKKKISLRGSDITTDSTNFEEKQYTDIWSNDEYLQFMYERTILLRELLSDSGCIYVHCDWHKSHYIRGILEEVFGSSNFRNEIIWKRGTVKGAKAKGNQFARNHDVLYLFSKTADYHFKRQYLPFSEEYKKRFSKDDNDGRGKYRDDQPIGTRSQESINRMIEENRIVVDSQGSKKIKTYLNELEGVVVDDNWTDISEVNVMSNERTDYPTQKPQKLLERIIDASSSPQDIVFDCFMGSGTTQAVAMKLGRKFIGADINLGAIQTTTKRLVSLADDLRKSSQTAKFKFDSDGTDSNEIYTGFQVYNVNHYDFFRNELEAKDLLLNALEIQPIQNNSLYDGEKDGRMVKIMPVNRIASRADLNELITNFDQKTFEKRQSESPNKPVEYLTLVCMGHEPDLAAQLQTQMKPFKLDIEVVDILRDKSKLEFKRDAEVEIVKDNGKVVIKQFYPMNLLQKLSLDKQNVGDWRELVESVMIDFNYSPDVLEPTLVDIPEGDELVSGSYDIPKDAGTIRIKITDLLSESLEMTLNG